MATRAQQQVNSTKIMSFVFDLIVSVLVVSIINLFVVSVFGFSQNGLMKQGIETAALDSKMQMYDYVSLSYLALLIAYLAYFRKFFSFGDRLFSRQK